MKNSNKNKVYTFFFALLESEGKYVNPLSPIGELDEAQWK
jgi:hypothetical protein